MRGNQRPSWAKSSLNPRYAADRHKWYRFRASDFTGESQILQSPDRVKANCLYILVALVSQR